MHRTRPGGLNGGEMYRTRAGSGVLLLLSSLLNLHMEVCWLFGFDRLFITNPFSRFPVSRFQSPPLNASLPARDQIDFLKNS